MHSFVFTKVLVTTDACSEGIDVPECNLVVSMDKIKTSRSLIHTRGRARSKGGKFIVMLEVRPKRNTSCSLVSTYSHLFGRVCPFFGACVAAKGRVRCHARGMIRRKYCTRVYMYRARWSD